MVPLDKQEREEVQELIRLEFANRPDQRLTTHDLKALQMLLREESELNRYELMKDLNARIGAFFREQGPIAWRDIQSVPIDDTGTNLGAVLRPIAQAVEYKRAMWRVVYVYGTLFVCVWLSIVVFTWWQDRHHAPTVGLKDAATYETRKRAEP